MRKRRIPDIRECMTAVTVEYRSRRPEIETEIFVPFGLRPRFGRYVRIGFLARIEHRNIIRETYRTEVGHAVVSVFSERDLRDFPRCRLVGLGFSAARLSLESGKASVPAAAEMSRCIPGTKACRPCFRSLRIFRPDTGTAVSVCRPVARVTVPPRARYARSHPVRVSANGTAERPGSARACRFLRHRGT